MELFVINIKMNGELQTRMMEKKLLRREKIIFLIAAILILTYRIVILFKFSFIMIDDDQAIMWYGTAAFAHFDFYEPCFFGQAYGNMIESLLAVPLYWLNVPLKIALPISTLIFTTLPFAYLCVKSIKNNKMVTAYVMLIIYSAMSYEWDILTSVPRAFMGGFIFGIIGCILINEEGKWYKYFIGSYLVYLGYIMTNTVIALAGMAYLALVLHNKINMNFIKKKLPGLFVGNLLGYITAYLIKFFYIKNSEYNLHPAFDMNISIDALKDSVWNLRNILNWFTPVNIGIIWIVIILLIIGVCIYKRIYRTLIMLLVSLIGLMTILSMNKINDYTGDNLMYGQLRMLLFVPYMIALIIYLCSYYNKKMYDEKIVYKVCVLIGIGILIILIIKGSIIRKQLVLDNDYLYESYIVHLQKSDGLIENAKKTGEIALQNNCDVVIEIDDNRAFGYVCGALNYNKFIQYNSIYDRRTWVYQQLQQPAKYRCLLVWYSDENGLSTRIVDIENISVVDWISENYGNTRR